VKEELPMFGIRQESIIWSSNTTQLFIHDLLFIHSSHRKTRRIHEPRLSHEIFSKRFKETWI